VFDIYNYYALSRAYFQDASLLIFSAKDAVGNLMLKEILD
jgi:hypothetical protein